MSLRYSLFFYHRFYFDYHAIELVGHRSKTRFSKNQRILNERLKQHFYPKLVLLMG